MNNVVVYIIKLYDMNISLKYKITQRIFKLLGVYLKINK